MKKLYCAPIEGESAEILYRHGYNVLHLKPSSVLPNGLKHHMDLRLLQVKDHLFADIELKDVFDKKERKRTFVQIGEAYPKDCALNVKIVGNYAIFNPKCIDKNLENYLKINGFTSIFVKQGYAGCSICKVSDSAIITADRLIAEKANEAGIDVLQIKSGDIKLLGYDTGFIGGCSFCDDQNVYFYGDVKKHSDGDAILQFINRHGKQVVCLHEDKLTDIGGFVMIG